MFIGFPGTGSSTGVGPANYGDAYQHPQSITEEDEEATDADDDVLDSFKMVRRHGKKHFCKCKRGTYVCMCEKLWPLVFFFKFLCPITGPVGPPGSPGIEGPRGVKGELGPRGEKGDAGSFDFFMLMMADLRHDLEQLQARVFPSARDSNRAIPRYVNLNTFHINFGVIFFFCEIGTTCNNTWHGKRK